MAAMSENDVQKECHLFSSATTMHGVKFVTENGHTLRKIFWSLIVLFMISLIVVSFTQSIIKYYKYESVTSTKLERNDSLILPAVTICNFNAIKKSSIVTRWPELLAVSSQVASLFLGLGIPENTNETHMDIMRRTKFSKFLGIAGLKTEDIFVSCIIGIEDLNCTKYVKSFFTDYGMCFTFNSDQYATEQGMLSTSLSGDIYGIALTVDVAPEEYLIPLFLGTGLQVLIHDPFVYPRMKYHKFVVEAGREVFVSMRLVEKNILPKPYSNIDCVEDKDDETLLDKYLGYGVRYSEEGCLSKCMMDTVYNCDCNLLSMDEDGCSVYDFYTCSALNLQTFYIEGLKHCNFCLPSCQSYDFEYRVSTTAFPNFMGEIYGKEKGWKITNISQIKERYAQLYIYYESLEIKKVNQIPVMGIIQFLSNIGGQLGLYLGASIITLLEIMDCAVMACVRCGKNKQKTAKVYPLKTQLD